jgi:hypothetical protein
MNTDFEMGLDYVHDTWQVVKDLEVVAAFVEFVSKEFRDTANQRRSRPLQPRGTRKGLDRRRCLTSSSPDMKYPTGVRACETPGRIPQQGHA